VTFSLTFTTVTAMSQGELAERLTSVSLHYACRQDLATDEPAVQQWWVTAVERDWERGDEKGDPIEETVALMHLVKGSLLDPSLWDQLDALEADLEAVASALLDQEAGQLRDEVYERIEGLGSSLLILNSVTVSTAWRGRGVGALLAGLALQVLGDDAACIATYPAPLDGSQGEARRLAIGKLEKVWTQLGFQSFAGGVWILDPASLGLSNAVDSMKAQFGMA
jgi:GNAT superfamily N-acetyltransferase